MALKPETIARIQSILDGTIKVEQTARIIEKPLSATTKADLISVLNSFGSQPAPTITFHHEEPTMEIEEASDEGLRNADEIIKILAEAGHGDYSAFRNQIALDIYENGHWNGNWDSYFNPDDYDATSTLPSLRVIQEDEYDQHMDGDEEKPDHDSMVGSVPNGYLWVS